MKGISPLLYLLSLLGQHQSFCGYQHVSWMPSMVLCDFFFYFFTNSIFFFSFNILFLSLSTMELVLISVLSLWQNNWDKQFLWMKGLFWLTLSEVSGSGWLALLLLGLWQGRTSWQRLCAEQSCLPHGSQEAKRKSVGALVSSLRPQPQWPKFPALVLISWVFYLLQWLHRLAKQACNTCVSGGQLRPKL